MIIKLGKLRETGSEEGFTLIELMIVVVIIGILAAIAIPIFMNQQKAAIVAGVKSDVKNTVTNIATALAKVPLASIVRGYNTGTTTSPGYVIRGISMWEVHNTYPGVPVALPTGSTTFHIPISAPNTRISIYGNWEAYFIRGQNSSVSSTFSVIYSSNTGETVTTGG